MKKTFTKMMISKVCIFVSAFCFLEAASAITLDDCPSSIPRDRYLRVFGTSCYQFQISQMREFNAAQSECQSHQGHLVIIDNLAENNFVYNTFLHDFGYNRDVWIGLSDVEVEGQFLWIDGSQPHFTYWATNQPEGVLLGDFEDCAVMQIVKLGHWGDNPCSDITLLLGAISESRHFVCEYPVGQTTTPPITTPAMPISTVARTQPPSPTEATTMPLPTTPTPVPTTHATHHNSHTTHPHLHTSTPVCPSFECGLDCGLAGYVISAAGCLVCECET